MSHELKIITSGCRRERYAVNCMTAQVLVRDQDQSFPKSHLELTFWLCLVHVINHIRGCDVKVMRHVGTSQSQRN
jgi:hypothetical protein